MQEKQQTSTDTYLLLRQICTLGPSLLLCLAIANIFPSDFYQVVISDIGLLFMQLSQFIQALKWDGQGSDKQL